MFEHLTNYQRANPSLWQGRKDTNNAERFFQKIIFPAQQTDLITKEKKLFSLASPVMLVFVAIWEDLEQN